MTYGSATGTDPYWEGHQTQLYWTGVDRPKGTKDPVELVRPHPFWKTVLERRQHRLSATINPGYTYHPPYNPEYWINAEEWWPNGVFPEAIYGLPPQVPDPWSSNDDLALLVGLKEQVVGGSANVAITIAEMGETLNSLASVTQRLAKLTEDARRSGPKKTTWYKAQSLAKKYGRKIYRNGIGKTLKDGWLEYRYAVMPLMYDIDAHCQTLANLHNRPQRNRFRKVRRVFDIDTSYNPNACVRWGPRKTLHSCRVVADIKSGPAKYLVYSGVSDPASVLWERIPYSFVADWILPVGDFLSAVDFVRKFEGEFVFTHKVERSCQGIFACPDDKGHEFWRFSNGGDYLYRYLTIDRQVTSSPPVPYPSLDLAIGKSKTSLKRALDAVSLFAYPRLKAGY